MTFESRPNGVWKHPSHTRKVREAEDAACRKRQDAIDRRHRTQMLVVNMLMLLAIVGGSFGLGTVLYELLRSH